MDQFKDKVAIVTGGASGIGRALCEELGRRGAIAIVADVNAEGAQQVADAMTAMGKKAYATRVDVSQAKDVQSLVDETVSAHGRLDYMFNNAGIGIAGEMRDMDLDHWRRILDVNLWGVIYGTTAAYQVMVEQGFGHIVNTASGAGLFPLPMGTAYATTKYAVVGLSTSLRPEAAALGVKVSVVCPGVIRTGIFDAVTYVKVKHEDAHARVSSFNMMEPADCARVILRGVAHNRAIIPVTPLVRWGWWFYRLCPALYDSLARQIARDFRASLRDA